jgi:prolyl oligopeptidase
LKKGVQAFGLHPLLRLFLTLGVAAPGTGAAGAHAATAAAGSDPYAWLENIDSPRALAWVRSQDEATARRLRSQPDYAGLYRDALAVLNSASRLPEIDPHDPDLYNDWKDAAHPRGIYRRTTIDQIRRADPAWQTVIDFDRLSAAEHRRWSFAFARWEYPEEKRLLVGLSLAGGDAGAVREFDSRTLNFVPGGFALPVAKNRVAWDGPDAIWVGTDFGPGTLSAAGYPLLVKRWQRGTALADAATVLRASPGSVETAALQLVGDGPDITLLQENTDFYRRRIFLYRNGGLTRLQVPPRTVPVGNFRGRLVLVVKDNWTVAGRPIPSGSILIADTAALTGGPGAIQLVLAESPSWVIDRVRVTRQGILVSGLHDVSGRLARLVPDDGGWRREDIPLPDQGTISLMGSDYASGDLWLRFETFTTPPALYLVPGGSTQAQRIRAEAPTFDGSRFETAQYWATSADGTRIPYYVVGPKNLQWNGRNPVWMFAYGGFEISVTPTYSGSYEELNGAYGKLWLERGGVFVLANLRGGGEFGPAWHEAALRERHVRAFEDFEAVARDIEARGLTSPAHLGIEGRSNGGLLVASTMLRHPELYGAVVCGNPLLDMKRYTHLFAGASWIAEYGDPDRPDDWAYLRRYSPYQNVRPGMRLPPILFYTTTRDDRVHPGHARKMAAKMEAMGYAVDYVENTEGGHHGSVTHAELATRLASTYTFLWEHLR